jgi:aminoglycoside phosphotransferase (APT) family kinase protein
MPAREPGDVASSVATFAGLDAPISPEWRWWRWGVHLPGDRIVFVADDREGWARLRREARLLERLGGEPRVTVPKVVGQSERGWVQIRRKIPGVNGFPVEDLIFGRGPKVPSVERYRPDFAITDQGRRLARDLGGAIAGIQQALDAVEARAWGFGDTDYLKMLDDVAVTLARFPSLADLQAAVPPLRSWFAALPPDPVLACRDLQMHNLAMSPDDGRLLGLFDFDDAAVAHRLEDFKYLPSMGIEFTSLALDGYASAGGPRLGLPAVWRFHLLSALEHFLFVPPDAPRWVEIADWSRRALAAMPPL